MPRAGPFFARRGCIVGFRPSGEGSVVSDSDGRERRGIDAEAAADVGRTTASTGLRRGAGAAGQRAAAAVGDGAAVLTLRGTGGRGAAANVGGAPAAASLGRGAGTAA